MLNSWKIFEGLCHQPPSTGFWPYARSVTKKSKVRNYWYVKVNQSQSSSFSVDWVRRHLLNLPWKFLFIFHGYGILNRLLAVYFCRSVQYHLQRVMYIFRNMYVHMFIKFRYSEKATKIWLISHSFLWRLNDIKRSFWYLATFIYNLIVLFPNPQYWTYFDLDLWAILSML